MLRFTGSLLLGAVCAIYGFSRAASLKRQYEFWTEFVTSLSVLETEITFGRYALYDIFKRLDNEKLAGLYTGCAAGIEAGGIRAAWRRAAELAAQAVGLDGRGRDTVAMLGAELGRSDVEGQRKAIKRTMELASELARASGEDYKRLGRVYRGCGMLAGALVVIIFL